MTRPSAFALEPFPGEAPPAGLRITGTIGRRAGLLAVEYDVSGDLSALSLPPPSAKPERRDRLWEGCCLELFLAEEGSERYLELNLSPAGHWNAYRFASYREGMREDRAIASLPFRVLREPGRLAVSLSLGLEGIVPGAAAVHAAICAVLRTNEGGMSHWALAHPGPDPDFHRRDGFTLTLRETE